MVSSGENLAHLADDPYEAQAARVAALVAEINRAFKARDFVRLAALSNRLATDGVIANALRGEPGAPSR